MTIVITINNGRVLKVVMEQLYFYLSFHILVSHNNFITS